MDSELTNDFIVKVYEWRRVATETLGWSDEFVFGQVAMVMAGIRGIELHDHTCHLASIVDS